MPAKVAMNKIGHALHIFEPVFKKVTFSDKMKQIARSLELEKPCIPQSMVISNNRKSEGQLTLTGPRFFFSLHTTEPGWLLDSS